MKGRIPGALAAIAVFAGAGTALAALTPEAGSPYTVGTEPYGAYTADFNGDSRPDIATVNGTSSDVSVLLRQPAGGFVQEAGSPIAVGVGPSYATIGDFNADGRPDIAVANFVSSSVSVLIRQAGGGFAAEPAIPVAGRASAVASGDFNGDGRLDLAVAQWDVGQVAILLRSPTNNGFALLASFPTGTNPRQIAVADFNGDGGTDLAVANAGSANVTILVSLDGRFVPEGPAIAVGSQPAGITAADFDGDLRSDLAVTTYGTDSVSILLRSAANTGFAEEPGSPILVSDAPTGIAAADLDLDGRPDLAVAANGGVVNVLRRNAGGGFTQDPPTPVSGGPNGVAVADLDADTRPDLAVSALRPGPGLLHVLLNPAPIVPTPTPTATPPPTRVLPAPVVGKTVNAVPVKGTVRIKDPSSNRYRELKAGEQIKVGTTIDTRNGRIAITVAEGNGKTATAEFFDGIFKLSQTTGSKPITTLTLTEQLSCPRARASSAAAKKKTRKLWGDGKGRFRTRGQYSAATVRGTKWLVQDGCGYTRTRVSTGSVSVRDEVTKRTVVLRKGRTYTARAG